eukprot:scaffold98432_cov33-Tisochrysis_lutea.AAC.4
MDVNSHVKVGGVYDLILQMDDGQRRQETRSQETIKHGCSTCGRSSCLVVDIDLHPASISPPRSSKLPALWPDLWPDLVFEDLPVLPVALVLEDSAAMLTAASPVESMRSFRTRDPCSIPRESRSLLSECASRLVRCACDGNLPSLSSGTARTG